ncbi:MAG TPA: cysteine hydrolase family protein [Propionibacteriaceae bacterium]
MSTLTGRDQTALLVVDVQNDVVGQAWQRDEVIGRIAGLVDSARAAEVPVVWVQHHDDYLAVGSQGWNFVDALVPLEGEPRIDKTYGDSFAETDLESVLGGLDVSHVVLCGAQSDFCITATLYGAIHRGYDVTLVADGHTTDDTEFEGVALSAEVMAAYLVRGATDASLPGIALTATPAASIAW